MGLGGLLFPGFRFRGRSRLRGVFVGVINARLRKRAAQTDCGERDGERKFPEKPHEAIVTRNFVCRQITPGQACLLPGIFPHSLRE